MPSIKNKPFLKWVGGKSKLIKKLDLHLPKEIKQNKPFVYVEPFLGGGAMFYYLIQNYNVKEVFLNDINKKLINTYTEIKNDVSKLIGNLKDLEAEYYKNSEIDKKVFYLKKRTEFNKTTVKSSQAALLIFLNKTCFNGMYRENSKGEYNVPFGDMKRPKICDEKLLISLNKLFKKVNFSSKSFNKTLIKESRLPIFYYLDPPYRAISKTSSFKDYSSENNFNDDLQKKLKVFCDKIHSKNNYFMQSNSFSEDGFFQNLYKNYSHKKIQVSRTIGADGSKRKKISELLIYNNE